MRDNEKVLWDDLKEQKEETAECVENMTQQYKRMEKLLLEDIEKYNKEVDA